MGAIRRVLIVCSGNTCRSPMAEALLRRELELRLEGQKPEGGKDSKPGDSRAFEVVSAGISALEGDPASPNAVVAMAESGLDISGHRAARLTRELVLDADLVLTMTRRHKEAILRLAPEIGDKVFTIGEFIGRDRGYEIPDPFGLSLEDYRKAARELQEVAREVAARLVREKAGDGAGGAGGAGEAGRGSGMGGGVNAADEAGREADSDEDSHRI